MYATRARRPPARSSANRCAIASDEVVTDANAIAFGILRLDDRAAERSLRGPLGEIDEHAWPHEIAAVVGDDSNDRSRQHLRDRVRGVHDRQLEGVEHDQRAD